MDAEDWMDPRPRKPSKLDFDLPRIMEQVFYDWRRRMHDIYAFGSFEELSFEKRAFFAGQRVGLTASEVSAGCARVRVWAEYQRRMAAKRMTEAELAVFRSLLGWKPSTAAWRCFEAYMKDRVGEWKFIAAGQLGSTDAARAVLRGESQGEYPELARQVAALCDELPPDWDPRQVERFPPGFPPDRKAVYRATPYRRYVG